MPEVQLLSAAVCALLGALTIMTLLLSRAGPPPGRPSRGSTRGRRFRDRAAHDGTPRKHPARERPTVDAATLLDMTSAMLRAGVGVEASLDRLSRDVAGAEDLSRVHRGLTAGLDWDQAWKPVAQHRELKVFGEHLAFAHVTGAPSVALLELAAAQARRERRHQVAEDAARLGVKMVMPLGLCFLPAFILIGVVPVVLGLLRQLA